MKGNNEMKNDPIKNLLIWLGYREWRMMGMEMNYSWTKTTWYCDFSGKTKVEIELYDGTSKSTNHNEYDNNSDKIGVYD
jgi:hypothetical protein